MSKTKPRLWNVVEHLETEEDIVTYWEAALENGDSAVISAALDDIAYAMTQIARETGLGRESLFHP